MRRTIRTRFAGAVIVGVALVGSAITVPAVAEPAPIADLESTRGFRKAVTVEAIREHQAAFQAIADANGGTRVAGSAGYDESADYVAGVMEDAGYVVTRQEFEFPFFQELSPSEMQQVSPNAVTYVNGTDFLTMDYSGSGDVTASVTPVDVNLTTPSQATSGCDGDYAEAFVGAPIVPDPGGPDDFAGFPAGNIALMQRGACTFGLKVTNAMSAGAVGAIIFNQGTSGRLGLFGGTLGAPAQIPALSISFTLGSDLVGLAGSGLTLRMRTETISEIRETENVIAETPDGLADRVIVIGAHLDSVDTGPGINDNGSGSATILEVARVFAQQERVTRNKLRFMWYGAEESGLIGSEEYVNSLSEAELADIELMLNFDMVGSPNYVRFVYDGDNSTFPAGVDGVQAGPPGSGEIESLFAGYFEAMFGSGSFAGSSPTPFNGRSDYGPFISVGIPAGGLFTGAEGQKTAQEALDYGGTAGVAYDVCYHQACDTFSNVSLQGLDEMSDAVAHAVLLFSRRNFTQDPL